MNLGGTTVCISISSYNRVKCFFVFYEILQDKIYSCFDKEVKRLKEKIENLKNQAIAEITNSKNSKELYDLKVKYLGKKGE